MQPLNYRKRLEQTKKLMEKENVDLILLTPSVNFGYLFKGFLDMRERLICAAIILDEEPLLIAPEFEVERMQNSTNIKNVVGWKEDEDPYLKLKKSLDFTPKMISLESTTCFENFLKFKEIFPNSDFLNAAFIFNDMRGRKTEAEIERIRKASEFTVKSVETLLSEIEPGMTEIEVQNQLIKKMSEISGEPSWALIQFDENSAIPHSSASSKKLREDSVILIDSGTSCDRYFSDITITTTFSKPSSKFLEIYDIVQKANDKALETSKEGVPAEQVDFEARRIIDTAGYGKYFTHRLGHGLGLEVHEHPYIVKGNKQPLIEGNVHTDEPGIYLPGKFGIRIEDDLIVRKDKSERIYEFDRIFWEKK
ncbi:MAG: M24 family metallopeptidase [Candidatus Heimdallarchaeaceae archaeon]